MKPILAAALLCIPAVTVLAQDAAPAASVNPSLLVMRWLHILGAAALLGAGIFLRLVLLPSAATLPGEARDQLRAAMRPRWSKVIFVLALILLVSGFYNYMVVGMTAHKGQGPYHMLMGIKILLAFAVFFLASLLAGKTGLAQKLQANTGPWLGVTVGLGTLIVLIAGYLRYFPTI